MTEVLDDEIMDLVDINDKAIGTVGRSQIGELAESGQGFVRAVGVFILNEQGQLWIPTRTMHKRVVPGGLDYSAGEHVGAGEDYDTAALRGMREELSMEPDDSRLTSIGNLPPMLNQPYFHEVYTYASNEAPNYNPNDFSSYEWLHPHELLARLEAGAPAKSFLLSSVQLLLRGQSRH